VLVLVRLLDLDHKPDCLSGSGLRVFAYRTDGLNLFWNDRLGDGGGCRVKKEA